MSTPTDERMTADEFNLRTKEHNWKWVKLTNETECHRGFQFQTGMNSVESNSVESNSVESNSVESNSVESNSVESNSVESNSSVSSLVSSLCFYRADDILDWAEGKMYVRDVTIPPSSKDLVVVTNSKHKAKAQQIILGERRELWDEAFCEMAVQRDGFYLQAVPKNKRTSEICKLAVQQNGYALENVPRDKLTHEICKLAVQQNGWSLWCVPQDMRTEELCKLAVQRYGKSLKYVPQDMRTNEICKLAVHQDCAAVDYVPQDMRNDEIYKLATQQVLRNKMYDD